MVREQKAVSRPWTRRYGMVIDQIALTRHWPKVGAVGVLRALIRYIRMTPRRRDEFSAIVSGGQWLEFHGLILGVRDGPHPAADTHLNGYRFQWSRQLPALH